MVGVPRSQGCRSCRRKKKGCDLQKPTCGQCARLGLTCTWEEKKWTFVEQNPVYSSSSVAIIPHRSRSNPDLKRSASNSPPVSVQERSLIRTAIEIEVISGFWDDFSPKETQTSPRVLAGYWAKTVRVLSALDKNVHLCLSAVASTALGRLQQRPELIQEGTRLYAKALRETNASLQDPIRAQSDATLASVKLLSLYENVRVDHSGGISTQAEDWHKHIEGTCRIVELRGPEKHVSHHGHALFEEARILAIISGMALRKPNFFTSPAWYTIPWETHPRNLRDELHDILIAVPDLLYKQDILTAELKSLHTNEEVFITLTKAQEHMNKCILVATSLRDWEQKAVSSCLEEEQISPDSFTGPLTLLEVCRNYGYGFFNAAMAYWAGCVVLFSSIWVMKRNVMFALNNTPSPTPLSAGATTSTAELPSLLQLPQIPVWINPRPAASAIASSSSHYYRPEAGFWGPWSATFPMGAALHFYAATGNQDSEEFKTMRELFKSGRFGTATEQFLRSMANTPKTKQGDTRVRQEHSAMASNWYGMDTFPKPAVVKS